MTNEEFMELAQNAMDGLLQAYRDKVGNADYISLSVCDTPNGSRAVYVYVTSGDEREVLIDDHTFRTAEEVLA